MIFLISLVLTALLIATGKDFLKKHAAVCYGLAVVLSALVVLCTVTGASAVFPAWVRSWIWPIFARSALSTALFAAVMYAGAVPNGSRLMKTVMPIRGELSIIASILTLGHNISFGMTYFRLLFTRPDRLPTNQLLAAVCSLVMLCIMIPLFVTSFKCVRRKMKGSSWKKLQRLAYVFYALIYIHVLLLTVPGARQGKDGYLLTVVVYSAVFLTCGALRVRKALRKQSAAWRCVPVAAAICAMIVVLGAVFSPFAAEPDLEDEQMEQPKQEQPEQEAAAETEKIVETAGESDRQDEVVTDGDAATAADEGPEIPAEVPTDNKRAEDPAEPEKKPETQETSGKPAAAEPQQPTGTQEPAPPEQPMEPEITYQYKNGTFSGSGEGFGGTITVNVTIETDKIINISVVSASDDEPYWSEGKGIISRILSAQSTNVDTVSGATFSSGGIRDAVKAALSSAEN